MASLQYYRCKVLYDSFTYGCNYIRYGDGEPFRTGLYINNNHQLECLPDASFEFKTAINSIKDVVCIYKTNSLNLGKVYSVYQSDNISYKILSEDLELTIISKKYFIDKDEWDKLDKEQRNKLCINIKNELEVFDLETQKKEKEKKLREEKEDNIKKEIKLVKSICEAITKDSILSKTIYKESIPTYIKKGYTYFSIIIFILGIIIKQPIIIGVGMLLLILNFILLENLKSEIINEEYEIDINHYEKLKLQNKLPLEILGKIKLIENELIILNYKKVNLDILKLLKQSINLTIYIATNEDYYEQHKEELNIKLNEFLDNTIGYINTLKENKKIEENFINATISEDILNMIDKNNELFISMIKDNHYLTDIYKNIDKEDLRNNKHKKEY